MFDSHGLARRGGSAAGGRRRRPVLSVSRCGTIQERDGATDLIDLATRLYKQGRYGDAHEHLDRAGATLLRLKDAGLLARVDGTRARVFLAERKYAEADRVISRAVRTLEQDGESALLADALTIHGVTQARLGAHENSLHVLRRAASVAEAAGARSHAGLAALSLIEEHGGSRLSAVEVSKAYLRADRLLKDTEDTEDIVRLRACARVAIRRLSGARLRDRNFTFYGAVQDFEEAIIEQALEEAGGGVTKAAKLLGLKHQSFLSMLNTRHRKLLTKRTPPEKKLRSIMNKE